MRLPRNQPAPTATSPGPSRRPRPARLFPWAAPAIGFAVTLSGSAETIAHWRFDVVPAAADPRHLPDSGPSGHTLLLGPGAEIVPGKFGQALRPTAADTAGFAARSLPPPPASATTPRPRFANITDSKLNLGPGDWTLEAWLRLEPAALAEGVIFEIGSDPRHPEDLTTRLSLLPRDNAFVLSGLAPIPDSPAASIARRVEFPNPEGPPGGVARRFTAALVADRPLPREVWFHAAIVHAGGGLHLVLDDRHCATTTVDLLPLPRSAEGYLTLGRDGRGGRPFPGAIDEVRVSDHVVSPAGSRPRHPPAPGTHP